MPSRRSRASHTRAPLLLLLSSASFGCDDSKATGPSGSSVDVHDGDASPLDPNEVDTPATLDDAGREDASDLRANDAAGDANAEALRDAASETELSDAASADASTSACDGGPCTTCSPQQEVCDHADNDCDGMVDENCYQAPFSIADFDVTDDGRAVAVGFVGDKLRMICFGADGQIAKAAFEVAVPELPSLKRSYVDVARADALGNVTVTYSYWNFPTQPNDWRTYAAFFDADCELVRAGALDADLPNTTITRQASLQMTDDGRSYFIYEHQSQGVYRVLGFDPLSTRTVAVTIPSSTECQGGALSRVLALDETSGKFAVVCERNGRIFRRYLADGTPRDAAFMSIPGYPLSTPFHYFGGALNASGTLLYFGRLPTGQDWIARVFDDDLTVHAATLPGSSTANEPRARVTAAGNFLVELSGDGFNVALLSTTGSLLEGFAPSLSHFEVVGPNRVYSARGSRIAHEDLALGTR